MESNQKILCTTRFDENSGLRTTYVGKVDTTRVSKIKVEETFPISEQGYTVGKLLDGSECQILLDTGASKSFTSKAHYLHCKSLHSLPKFAFKMQRIQVGNGQYVSVLFITLSNCRHTWTHIYNIYISVRDTREHRFNFRHQEYI